MGCPAWAAPPCWGARGLGLAGQATWGDSISSEVGRLGGAQGVWGKRILPQGPVQAFSPFPSPRPLNSGNLDHGSVGEAASDSHPGAGIAWPGAPQASGGGDDPGAGPEAGPSPPIGGPP